MIKPVRNFLHHQVWRRLPVNFRREMLFQIADILRPRITHDVQPKLPVIVVGMLRQASGLGAAARASYKALEAHNIPVYGIDLTSRFLHDTTYPNFQFKDARDLTNGGTLLIHLSGPLIPLAFWYLGKSAIRERYIIAHWFWELPRLPRDWRRAMKCVHEVHVNTQFVADAVRPMLGGKPMHILPYPMVHPPDVTAQKTGGPFTVLMVFNMASNFERKNPIAGIRAFRKAFGGNPNSRLIVKCAHASVWPDGVEQMKAAIEDAPNIEILSRLSDDMEMDALYSQADIVLSLHRSEGLGLVLLEAMLRGIPVVATDWSGNIDFLTQDTGLPVGYDLVDIDDPQGNYSCRDGVWAEAKIDEAAAGLKRLSESDELRHALATAGREHALKFCSVDRYCREIAERVSQNAAH